MTTRRASAIWNGTLKEGNGTMRLSSGAYEGPYKYASRFEEGQGTNPEELIGAAHAGCFSMALSGELNRAGFNPSRIETTAEVILERIDGKATITRIHLITRAEVAQIDERTFQEKAQAAKEGCPISRLLQAAEISIEAQLV
jgi:lipoyl-dependent peroxiredoxin